MPWFELLSVLFIASAADGKGLSFTEAQNRQRSNFYLAQTIRLKKFNPDGEVPDLPPRDVTVTCVTSSGSCTFKHVSPVPPGSTCYCGPNEGRTQ